MIRRVLWRLLLEEGGWSRIWYGLATAMIIAGGGLIYQQVQTGGTVTSCPLPAFPDASCTGYTGSLTSYSGPNPVVTDNTVIDSKDISACLNIEATNVTIRNSYIHANGCTVTIAEDPSVCISQDNGTRECTVTVEDSTLDCLGGGTAVYYRNYTVRRTEITGCENAFDASASVTVEDNWVHDLWQGAGAHTDGLQLSGGLVGYAFNVTITHNHFTGLDDGAGVINSDIIGNGGDGDTNIVIHDNLFGGSGYQVYCSGWEAAGSPGTGDEIINNHFKNDYGYGHSTGCGDAGWTQSGNVDYPGGSPLTLG